jgi:hypothetical protein
MRANLGLLQQFAYLPALGTKHHELRLCQEIECLTHHFMLLPAEDKEKIEFSANLNITIPNNTYLPSPSPHCYYPPLFLSCTC